MIYACHCTDCQKRSGSAFGLSMWVRRTDIEVTKGEAARLWSEPQKHREFAIVRPGTLDDRSWLRPAAHLWTRSAQPWFVFPEGVPRYETQPESIFELTKDA